MTMHRRTLALILSLTLAAALPLSALAGCQQTTTVTGSDTLRIGVRSDVSGFGYHNDETDGYYGLEIDIARELAARLGYKDVQFTSVTPDTRKETLANDQVDCLVATYSISASREENFDFSPSYYQDPSVLVVEQSSEISKLSQLKGMTIGTMAGTNAAPQLAAKLAEEKFSDGKVVKSSDDNSDIRFDNYRIKQFNSYKELSDALEAGTVDAMAVDKSIASAYMNDRRKILGGFTIATQEYGVATNKGSALSEPVGTTIQGMLDDGTIAGLVDKWD